VAAVRVRIAAVEAKTVIFMGVPFSTLGNCGLDVSSSGEGCDLCPLD
jgi:hypothetical protein